LLPEVLLVDKAAVIRSHDGFQKFFGDDVLPFRARFSGGESADSLPIVCGWQIAHPINAVSKWRGLFAGP
jgi:hypothetical protein